MMAKSKKSKIVFDDEAIMKFLQKVAPEALDKTAEEIADNVRTKVPDDVPVEVYHGLNKKGRPYSMVAITHPSGEARQIKHGVLTRSAAESGIKTKRVSR